MDPAATSVLFRNVPSAPTPSYKPAFHQHAEAYNEICDNNDVRNNNNNIDKRSSAQFHVSDPSLRQSTSGVRQLQTPPPGYSGADPPPIGRLPHHGQLMNDLKAHHSAHISQHPQAAQSVSQIPPHHISSQGGQYSNNPNNNNNNNNVFVVPQMQQPVVAAPGPQVTAINIGGMGMEGVGRKMYRREANHLVHCLLSVIFPPWMFVWCIVCCCYGCPNICCCCDDGDACENFCPKHYERTPASRRTTYI